MLSLTNVLLIAHAIYITEGSDHTRYPYGIKQHYVHTSPLQACCNTIQHYAINHHCAKVTKEMIIGLGDVYCPVKDDPIGNKRWKSNMIKILKESEVTSN